MKKPGGNSPGPSAGGGKRGNLVTPAIGSEKGINFPLGSLRKNGKKREQNRQHRPWSIAFGINMKQPLSQWGGFDAAAAGGRGKLWRVSVLPQKKERGR